MIRLIKLLILLNGAVSISNAQVFTQLGSGFDNAVRSISIDTINNLVYVGGQFNMSGSKIVRCIAKWNLSKTLMR